MDAKIHIEDPFGDRPKVTGFALLFAGFRIFFFLAAVMGALAVPVWIVLLSGRDVLGLSNPTLWHGHEMLFGYTSAAIAGFFLTVVPNWTGRKGFRKEALMGLALAWVLGRVAFWSQGLLPLALVAAVDLSFLVGVFVLVLPPLIQQQHRRQFVFLPILAGLIVANALVHAELLGLWDTGQTGLSLGLNVTLVLIVVMGGRVTPSFTINALMQKLGPQAAGQIKSPALVEQIVFSLMWVLVLADLLDPLGFWSGVIAALAAGANFWRLMYWQGWRTLDNPILWVLHLGYLWLVVGLSLKALAAFDVISWVIADHGLAVGCIGTMTLAIMSRASLGHTGRVIRAHPLTISAYVLVSVAAILRMIYGHWGGMGWLYASGGAWTLAFVAFLVVYLPILTRPRIDGRAG